MILLAMAQKRPNLHRNWCRFPRKFFLRRQLIDCLARHTGTVWRRLRISKFASFPSSFGNKGTSHPSEQGPLAGDPGREQGSKRTRGQGDECATTSMMRLRGELFCRSMERKCRSRRGVQVEGLEGIRPGLRHAGPERARPKGLTAGEQGTSHSKEQGNEGS